ncbi:sodium:proton antiporter [Winogradskyella sp. PC-19]|uniref:cation:proton antiporter n=1 Tax=unclassified Winogradskyella TaxID=2615021 RepID=UPI000B3C34AF|nr:MULTISPECIES: sodium:proton antiporter [unclassified Winogradskyella]ARV09554.1 sodium:proton antiporter [Winogradskyella sp. PC-19]RZN83761.1 MAG: sodium:proton antiporter [Winogradskyella sp.]
MDYFGIASTLIVISALFGYINVRFLKLPITIGLVLITIVFTLVAVIIGQFDDTILQTERDFISNINFGTLLLDVMLSFLLFAGALHTNFDQLKIQRWPILAFSTIGVLVSTLLVGVIMYPLLTAMGFNVNFIHCLLFGALISPTDPIAVLGILKKVGAPKKLETKIVGESLFNDGVGVVIFLTIYAIAKKPDAAIEFSEIATLFIQEVGGGILLGGLLGWLAYRLMKSINNYEVEVIITLAVVMGGTLLADKWHLSAPLSMVTAGLIVGNDTVRETSMSDITEVYVDKFWELIDVLFNTILFVMIGMEMLVLPLDVGYVYAGLLAIPILLMCRYMSLFLPIKFFAKRLDFVPKTTLIMTWGGLRGGISIALALSLTADMSKDLFLVITYIVVIVSIIGQGLTVGPIIKGITKKYSN